MSECNNKFLIAYKNYPTKFSDINWLSIGFDSQISLTGFAMDFKLGTATRHFTDLSQASVVNLTKTETNALDIGLNNASIIVTDTSNNSKPFTTAIPVMVKNWVEGDQKLETFNMNVDVKLEGTTQFTIKIDGAVIDPSIIDTRISEHNTSEQAHQFIQQNITIEATARASADTNLQTQINGKQDTISDLETIRTGAGLGATALQPSDVVNNLTSTGTNVPLSANMGKVLKDEIDTIISKSDVVDIVGTYAELQRYDTSKLHNNDIIKVLADETHSNAETYYRWNTTTQTFTYIGSLGPFEKLANKTDTINAQSTATQYPSASGVYNYHDSTKYDASNPSGYTSNTGTVTSVAVSMNGSTKGTVTTSGTIDLGTVITEHQDISGKENISNKVTSLSAQSTNTQYPSALCVWNIVGDIEATINTIRGVA